MATIVYSKRVHVWVWRAVVVGVSWMDHQDGSETVSIYLGPIVVELFLKVATDKGDT